jgi:hypothetical protein
MTNPTEAVMNEQNLIIILMLCVFSSLATVIGVVQLFRWYREMWREQLKMYQEVLDNVEGYLRNNQPPGGSDAEA